MIINHNISAINAHRKVNDMNQVSGKDMEKLSSGMRINRAGDDAAGLVISEKMRAQIRGLDQASRNIQDAISLVQTAEGGMNEVHSLLQRGRELSVQSANDTNTLTDRQAIQDEVDQIVNEIDRISEATEFNSIKLLNNDVVPSDSVMLNIINGLKSGWLQKSADLVSTYYGLTSSNRDLAVDIVEGTPGGTLAAINQTWSVSGATATLINLTLNIEKSDFTPSTGPDGTNSLGSKMYDDRIIAHEMVHAVMADSMGDAFYDLPTWFKEGTAEFIQGADERLKNDVALSGGIQNIVDRGADIITGALSWGATPAVDLSKNYSAAYLAVKYLQHNFDSGNMKDFMADLKNGLGLDTAIANHTVFADLADFVTQFKANGAAYYGTLDMQAIGVDELDTGSIMGSDHLNVGGPLNAEDVVPTGTYSEHPTNFNVIFPTVVTYIPSKTIQLGANTGQTMTIILPSIKSASLGISGINVVSNSNNAITTFDEAIKKVSLNRSVLGAVENRLEYALNVSENYSENLSASESRIRDLDMAKAMINFSKSNIISQAAQAMLAQANQQPQGILQLLR